jgi:hypothetical protein
LRLRLSRRNNNALLIKDKVRPVADRWVGQVDVRDKARFVGSRFSSAQDRRAQVVVVARREAVRHSIVRAWITAEVRIPPALAGRVSRHVQEWVRGRVGRLRACRPNRQDAQGLNHAVQDSVISMDLKKVQ